jgi:hypothetical protein
LIRTLLATLALATLASPVLAQQDDGTRWYFQTSLAIQHWSPSPEHVKYNALLNLERHTASNFLVGGAQFKNSFGQPSQFLYVGKTWRPLEQHQYMYLKLSAGVVHGYKDQYRDKIPFRRSVSTTNASAPNS